MANAPYINDRMRALLDHNEKQAFLRMVRSKPHTVLYHPYAGASTDVSFTGDVAPTFGTAVSLDALVESAMTEQNQVVWGTDERTQKLVYVLTSKANELGINTDDHITIDGERFEILSEHNVEGMGHETFLSVYRLAPETSDVGA